MRRPLEAKRFRVWRGPLSGVYFAGFAAHEDDGRWRMTGERHDVTDDIERIIAETDVGDSADLAVLRRVHDEQIELIPERHPLSDAERVAWLEGQRDLLDYLLTGRRR